MWTPSSGIVVPNLQVSTRAGQLHGTLEPALFPRAQQIATRARAAGVGELTFQPMVGGHSPSIWDSIFSEGMVRLFGAPA